MLDRRRFLTLLSCLACSPSAFASREATDCIFGAIRWDGQYCDSEGDACFEEERALGDSKWQFRAPLHTQIIGPNQIRFAPSQATFDAEIRAAQENGIKYWSYLMYEKDGIIDLNHPMMRGLSFHRSSAVNSNVRYTMMLTVDTLGMTNSYEPSVNAIVQLMSDTNYLSIMGKRPVLYFYYEGQNMKGRWQGSLANLAAAFHSLRKKSQEAGIGDPYITVLTTALAPQSEQVRAAIGGDAISAYAILPDKNITTYSEFDAEVRSYWANEISATNGDIVPTVMIGWDQRPRKEHPPAYDHRDHSKVDLLAHVTAPTPMEFRSECQAAVDFINSHRERCDSRMVLIYAWNENSEGGALEPTLGDPNASLMSASREVIK